jgi:uncharacterized protein YbgA (DUF1722 family)/uncharacterized protein YbbK (DUF523 family)
MGKPSVGVSACLVGQPVRYNGEHKKHRWITDQFAEFVSLHPLCPELAMGLSTPRPAIRLVETAPRQIRLVTTKEGKDLTEMAELAASRLLSSEVSPWDGFILKKDSPSCGAERVKLYGSGPMPSRQGEGFFARRLKEKYPMLPYIEEGRLSDPEQCEQFVTRVFAHYRLKQVPMELSQLQTFHRNYKLILMEHSPKHYQILGRIVANPERQSIEKVMALYGPIFMEALSVPSNRQKRVNVLQHVMGYFKKMIDAGEKRQILEIIQEYRQGLLPFVAPLSLLHYLVKKFSVNYLEEQFLFYPYPKNLGLRKGI